MENPKASVAAELCCHDAQCLNRGRYGLLRDCSRGNLIWPLPTSCSGRTVGAFHTNNWVTGIKNRDPGLLGVDDYAVRLVGTVMLRSKALACWSYRVSSISYERHAPLAPAVLRVRLSCACEDAVLRHCAGVRLLHEADQDVRVVLEQHHAPLRSNVGWSERSRQYV